MSFDRCSVKQFAIKRFFRLVPVLWLVIIIALIATTLTKDFLLNTAFKNRLIDAFKVMFCVQDIIDIDNDIHKHLIFVS